MQDQWFDENVKAIQSRTAFLADLPEGVVHRRAKSVHQLRVERRGDQLQLFFYGSDSAEVMSRMDIRNPLNLISPYTQAMMLVLAWQPSPKRVYMLGFGAGRVPMILHSYFPDIIIECAELDPDVVEVAQEYFGIALDERLTVAVEDGRRYLEKKSAQYDIICVDAFRGTGNSPFPLATKEFYELCKGRLNPGGIISVNLLKNDTLYRDKVSTITASFKNVYVAEAGWGAVVIFATDGESRTLSELATRTEEVAKTKKFMFSFAEHVHKLKHLSKNDGILHQQPGNILSDSRPPDVLPLPASAYAQLGRNDACPCGSGKKFKKCHYLQKANQ
jgi:spermidine synthase